MSTSTFVEGGLVLYYQPVVTVNAATMLHHVEAFERYSRFKFWKINIDRGFPPGLENLRFRILILDETIFSRWPFAIPDHFLEYLEKCQDSYKIVFFQDEHRACQARFAFLNRYKIDCLYTLLEPRYFDEVYRKYTKVPKLVYCLPGYVDDSLLEIGQVTAKPDEQRTIDVGYRASPLPYFMGRGGQEKHLIADEFKRRSANLMLKLNIETDPSKRLYQNEWYQFMANCRAMLGVETGVSIFDLDGSVFAGYKRLIAAQPEITFEEMSKLLLEPWEDRITYRTIGPRHFEAAALRVCQIMFEGYYSGVLKPLVHYIPLRKDFSNFEEVIQQFQDKDFRQHLVENAHHDLIASGKYSYRQFIQDFEAELAEVGIYPTALSQIEINRVTLLLTLLNLHDTSRLGYLFLRRYPFPGKARLKQWVKRLPLHIKNAQPNLQPPEFPIPPVISVVIPVYNAAEYIEETLQSVLNQFYQPLEILVVDAGSSDQTTELVRKLAAHHPKIKLLEQAKAGINAARNAGILHTEGNYIALMDQTDRWLPEYLVSLVNYLQPMDIVKANYQQTDKSRTLLSGTIIARSLWDKVGPFVETLEEIEAADQEWLIRAKLLGTTTRTY